MSHHDRALPCPADGLAGRLSRGAAVLVALLPLACSGGDDPRTARPAGSTGVAPAPGRVPVSYRWLPDFEVPVVEPAPEGIPFGERGRGPATGLYLTFDGSDPAAELVLQPEGWAPTLDVVHAPDGRFGSGVRLSGTSLLRCPVPESARRPRVVSVDFWVRPDPLRQATLIELSGLLTVGCTESGWLRVEVPGAGSVREDGDGREPLRFGSKTHLLAGQWNHVGLVFDAFELPSVRVVVNGQANGRSLDPEHVPGGVSAVLLGDLAGNGGGLPGGLDELRVEHRNVSSAEFEEGWLSRPRPVERAEVDYADGTTETLELWTSVHEGGALAGDEQWALGELEHVAIRDGALCWSPEDWRDLPTVHTPLPRTTHPTIGLGRGRVFVFGGEIRDTHHGGMVNTNDTWILDTTNGHWRRIDSEPAPSPRCHMPAAYSPDHDLVLVVGGWRNDFTPGATMQDCWVLHVGEERWEERSAPPRRAGSFSDHGLVYLPRVKSFLVLRSGGNWLYDPAADEWRGLPPSRTVTAAGEEASFDVGASTVCVADPESGLVLTFGGSYGPQWDVFSDTTTLYDPETNTYTVLDLPESPSPRVRGASAYDPKRKVFVYFGGVQDQFSARHDDLWTFDPRQRRWREFLPAHDRPSPRGGFYGMAYDELADRFVVVQGRNAPERWLDETLSLGLDPGAPGRARYVLDRADLADDAAWFADVHEPAGTSVRFRYCASDDGNRFGAWSDDPPAKGRYLKVEVVLSPDGAGTGPSVQALGFRLPD